MRIERRRINLGGEAGQLLKIAIRAQSPSFVHRLKTGVVGEALTQPWFRRTHVLEVISENVEPTSSLHTALLDGRGYVLTGHIEHINWLVENDPPPRLTDEVQTMAYGNITDHWSTMSQLGELLIEQWDDIPFYPDCGPIERELMEATRKQLEAHIGPPKVRAGRSGWILEKWLVTGGALIRRELAINANGEIRRRDDVLDNELPVPKGKKWGMDSRGRLVPLG